MFAWREVFLQFLTPAPYAGAVQAYFALFNSQ